jgi:hypothetical protein
MKHFPRLVLAPPDLKEEERYVCRPLLGKREGREVDMPWLVVAKARSADGGVYEYAERTSASEVKDLVAQATRVTNETKHEWTVSETSGLLFWKKPSLLRATGDLSFGMDDFSSDLVVHETALAAAGHVLGSTSLFAVVPKRGWLLVAAGEPGELSKMAPMHQAADGIFGRAEKKDALTQLLFFVKDGKLGGWSSLGGGSGVLTLSAKPEESAWLDV